MGCKWTEAEIDELTELYLDGNDVGEIASTLGRTKDSVWRKASDLGISHGSRWTDDDVERLSVSYRDPSFEMEDIIELLDKSRDSIMQKASRMGLERARRDTWSEQDIDALRQSYPDYSFTIDDLAKKLGRTKGAIISMAMNLGISRDANGPRANGNIRNERVFSMDTEEAAYWAGFLMADGCVHRSGMASYTITLVLSTMDEVELARFQDFIGCSLPIRHPRTNAAMLAFNSPRMASDLERWGVIPKKTWVGTIPSNIPGHLLPHYVRGLIDGDGGIHVHSGRYIITFANNEAVTRSVADIFRGIGIEPRTYVAKRNERTGHTTHVLRIGRRDDVQRAVRWLGYDDPEVPALARKRARAQTLLA